MSKLFSSVLKKAIIVAAIIPVMILTACLATNKIGVPNEPPEITIKSGSTEIFYVVGKNIWNGAVYDRENTFIAQKERIFNRDMPYIKNGAKITVSFGGNKPDSINLSEIILDEHGNAKWRTDEHAKTYEVDFPPFGGTGTFTIEPNYATTLSSHSADHEAGNTIKGYRMVCSWGKNECEYAFVILGDPAIIMSTEPSETDTSNIGPSTVYISACHARKSKMYLASEMARGRGLTSGFIMMSVQSISVALFAKILPCTTMVMQYRHRYIRMTNHGTSMSLSVRQ